MNSAVSTRSTRIAKAVGGIGIAAGLIVTLAGCSVNTTVPADGVADLAASALSEQWNADATVDCGDDSVAAEVGTELECVAHNPNSGLDYPATVTITEVDGSNLTVSVATGPAIVEDDGEDGGGDEGQQLTTSPESVEELAAGALAGQFGFTPVLDCGADPIVVEVGNEIECTSTHENGHTYPATVTISEVQGTQFGINVVQGTSPIE